MESAINKWIIYDGNCGLCLKSKRLLTKWGVFAESRCLNYHKLDVELKSKIDAERFQYEMALVDENSKQTLYGLEGILSIFSERISWLKLIKRGTLVFLFLEFFYHTISYNRYFLFPRKKVFECDCDPPYEKIYYWRWIGTCLITAVVVSFLLGYSSADFFEIARVDLAGMMLLIVGLGWAIQIFLSKSIMSNSRFREYSQHLALIALVGVLILIPSIVFALLSSSALSFIYVLVSVVISSGVMSYMHFKRVAFMRLNQLWTLSWFICLQSSAFFLSYHFKLFEL